MALVKCRECGHQISTTARACPSCGAAVRRTSAITKLVAALIGVTVVVARDDPAHAEAVERRRFLRDGAGDRYVTRPCERGARQEQRGSKCEAERSGGHSAPVGRFDLLVGAVRGVCQVFRIGP